MSHNINMFGPFLKFFPYNLLNDITFLLQIDIYYTIYNYININLCNFSTLTLSDNSV